MSNSDYNFDNILSNFPICLRKNIEELCLRTRIGLSDVTINDIAIIPNKVVEENDFEHYHFLIKVPYAGNRLKWEIIFDPEDFNFTPDFDFNDDHFLENPDHDIIENNIPSLINWDITNPKMLSQVLNEFLLLYKKIQLENLKQENIYSDFYEEYKVLTVGENCIEPENIEVKIESNCIHFLISIQIDCSDLPPYVQPLLFRDADYRAWHNPGEDFAHLKILIANAVGLSTNPSLHLSPRLNQALGTKSITLPEYKRDMTLLQYVTAVKTIIDNRIAFMIEHYKMKKMFVSTLVAICNCSIIEYDTESFNKVVFLQSVDDYSCLVSVMIGPKFPQDKPTVTLCSIYCQEGRNCLENFEKYVYNMDDKPEENIMILLKTLNEAISNFKNHKH